MQPTVWIRPGVLLMYGTSLNTDMHKHHALQLVWSDSNAICQFEDGSVITGSLLINTQVCHQLSIDAGWVLLVEPQSHYGQEFSRYLDQRPTATVAEKNVLNDTIVTCEKDPTQWITVFFSELGLAPLPVASGVSVMHDQVLDKRIQQLLIELDRCLTGECIKPSSWRASEVASSLALSESRFLHLFRQHMGIAWRPYLLWRRLMCAIRAMKTGASATQAAYMSGFSDSAHLSRTFRRLFGLSVREAVNSTFRSG